MGSNTSILNTTFTSPRFIIAQVQDDFYGNVGTYKVFELKLMSLVDNKNRVLSLRTTLGSLGSIRIIGGSNPPLGTKVLE